MKLVFATTVGLVVGMLLMALAAIGSFVSGLFVGWQLFAEDEAKELKTFPEPPIETEVSVP